MSKIQPILLVQGENDIPQVAENYTYVNVSFDVTPQFGTARDNVTHLPVEMFKAEERYREQQGLRFFRMR